jgi:hypothetical protein
MTAPEDVAYARTVMVGIVRDTGGARWKYPRVKTSIKSGHVHIRVGWRWTARSLHISWGKDSLDDVIDG